MSKNFQLTIAEPCHENWENMSPVQQGKFCGSCQKQVVDFSGMNDRQIAEFFKKPSTGSVCGRFMSDQLDRPIDVPRKRIPWFKYFFTILLPTFFVTKGSAQMGKVAAPRPVDTTRRPLDHEFRTLGMVAPKITPICTDTSDNRLIKGEVVNVVKKVDRIVVNGRVVNEAGEPIPGASVRIVHNGKIFAADASGKFSFHSTKDQLVELELTSAGYLAEHYLYPLSLQYSSIIDITIQMKQEVKVLDEVVLSTIVCNMRPETLLGVVTFVDNVYNDAGLDVIQGIAINEELPIVNPKILVYPNPVVSGAVINLNVDKLDEGYYRVLFMAAAGQMVQQKEIWIDAEARLLTMDVPRVAAGSYFMILVNKKSGKKVSEKIIIQ